MTQQGRGRLRRLGVLVAVPAISAMTLAACGSGDDDGGSGSGGTADGFTFAFGNASGSQTSAFQVLADNYQKATGIKVEAKPLPPDSYGLTLRTQFQGGNAPDVVVVNPGSGLPESALPLAKAGYLEPLGQESTDLIPEGNEALFQIDGKTYAQPTEIVPVGMVWNPDAASDAGVDVPEDFDALLDACGKVGGGKSFFVLAGSVPPNLGLMMQAISATRVYAETPDWNQQRADGNVTFADSEGWQDTLQAILDMNEAGCFQQGAAGGGFDAITQGITQGSALSAFVPGGAATELNNATPGLKLDIQAFPPASGQDPFLLASPNYALAINADADDAHKKAAEDFLAWAAEPENAAEFIKASGGVAVTGPDDSMSPVYEPVADLLKDKKYAALPTLEWPNPSIYDALSTGIQGLLAGQGDVETVLKAADQAWDNG